MNPSSKMLIDQCYPYHSNCWRQKQFSCGHNSEVSNIDQNIAHSNQGNPNNNRQWQVPEINQQKKKYFKKIQRLVNYCLTLKFL